MKCFINSTKIKNFQVICADNQIHLLKMPSMEILRTISGIKVRSYYHPKFFLVIVGLSMLILYTVSVGVNFTCILCSLLCNSLRHQSVTGLYATSKRGIYASPELYPLIVLPV